MSSIETAKLRRSIVRRFAAIALVTACALVVAVLWIAVRVDTDAMSHVVLLIGTAACVILGFIGLVARAVDDEMLRALIGTSPETEDSAPAQTNVHTLRAKSAVPGRLDAAFDRLRKEVDRSKTGGPHAQIHSALTELEHALRDEMALDAPAVRQRGLG